MLPSFHKGAPPIFFTNLMPADKQCKCYLKLHGMAICASVPIQKGD